MSTRAPEWSATAIAQLRDAHACPRCSAALIGQICPQCNADYRGAVGAELWAASRRAVAALEARQEVLDRVPVRADADHADVHAPAAAPTASGERSPEASPPGPLGPAGSSATVQSVLAVAGAGLVAIAAIVFTFFTPDLTDAFARGLIVAGVTLVFVAGARVLARRALQFSAETVGALAIVFLGLDIHALTAIWPGQSWAITAAATAVAGAAMTFLGLRVHIRVWMWTSLLALAVVPAMIGYAAGSPVLGHLGVAVASFALLATSKGLARRFGDDLRGERASLTALQLLALVVAIGHGFLFGFLPSDAVLLSLGALLAASAALALFSTRHPAARMWSFLAGAFAVSAAALLPPALSAPWMSLAWQIALVPAAAVTGAIVAAVLIAVPKTVDRGPLVGGALAVVCLVASGPVLSAIVLTLSNVFREGRNLIDDSGYAVGVVLGLAALASGLVLFDAARRRLRAAPVVTGEPSANSSNVRWIADLGLWLGGLAALALVSVPGIVAGWRVAIGLALAIGFSLLVRLVPRVRSSSLALEAPLATTAHVLVALSAIVSCQDLELAVLMGPAVVIAIAAVALAVPSSARWMHVGVGYAYSLAVFATALVLQGVDGVSLVCLTTSLAAVGAIAATFTPWVRVRAWYAVLAVTSVPFLTGVAQVVFVRSGWTALSTGIIFLLALTLVVTRRAGLGIPLRVVAATMLMPSLAVVVVCLGAELLEASGSPVVLPVIAVLVALVLPGGPFIADTLSRRIGQRDAALARLAIEASTLLTAAIAVLLALLRDAAGLPTALLVLVIVGVGGTLTALRGGRRYGWWLAAAAFTGALWCGWGIAGIAVPEPYLLPPALAASVVGAVLAARGARGVALYAIGLSAAIVPVLVLAAVGGPSWRAFGLVGAAWLLCGVGALLRSPTVRAVRLITLASAIVAGAAGAAQGVRFGLGLDAAPGGTPLVITCLGVALAGAVPAAFAARTVKTEGVGGRWLFAPAYAYVAVGTWTAIQRDWFTIWTMWTLMLAILLALVLVAGRSLRGATAQPPVWFIFALAFVTAVVAWSPRDLRVEWFSLPLGFALLSAGVLGMRRGSGHAVARSSANDWPRGYTGSWALLAPGIVVMMSASVVATFTDPLTWRAILVILLALAAILVGASKRLAAPFLIGIVVLPVENVIAFMVQIGRRIESMPWWITLAVVGAVLLIIAVTYERRAGEESGIAARLRDLS